jgi:subtilase family serine protease
MRARPIALTLLGTVAGLSAAVLTPVPAQAGSAAPSVTQSCATPTRPGVMTCFALRRTGAAASGTMSAMATPGGYGPADLRAAYKLPATGGTGATVAIVDAYDNPRAEADLATYRAQFGLPACTTANGCFRKVNQNGAASPLPAADAGWAGEIALDLDMVSAICPACKILLVEANSAYDSDLFVAEDRAVTLGAKYVSNSWGGGEFSG